MISELNRLTYKLSEQSFKNRTPGHLFFTSSLSRESLYREGSA